MAFGTRLGSWSARRQRSVGIGALVASQSLDVVTTLYGLRTADVVELNPIAVAAMAALGRFPGLLLLGSVTLLGIVLVTESATRRWGGTVLGAARLRLLGYGPATAISLLAAVNNAVVSGAI